MNIREGVRAVRAPFFTASVIPVMVGSAVVIANHEGWSSAYFFLTLVGVILIQAGTNLANDYYDYKTGNDAINKNRSPFNGGSVTLVEGVFQPREIKLAFTAFYALSLAIALYLALNTGWPVLVIAVFGILSGYYYSAPPLYLASRGVGEFLVGLNFGTLIVMGTYFVQAGSFTLQAFYASLPIALLITSVLMVNQFPDYEADKAVGKKHLVVRLGKKQGVKVYIAMVALAYILVLLGLFLGLMPRAALLALLPGILAVKGIRILIANYNAPRALLPANVITVKLHLFTGLLLALGFLLGG